MVLSRLRRLFFSCHCGVRSAQSLARPAITLKRILIGTKTGDKGLMKELIDNTHSAAYSPQSHSDRRTNTHSCRETAALAAATGRTALSLAGRSSAGSALQTCSPFRTPALSSNCYCGINHQDRQDRQKPLEITRTTRNGQNHQNHQLLSDHLNSTVTHLGWLCRTDAVTYGEVQQLRTEAVSEV